MVNIKHILLATDFSAYSKEAQEFAVHLAKKLGGELYLLHVFEPTYFSPGGVLLSVLPEDVHQYVKQVKEEESKRLNALADEIRHKIPKVQPIFKIGLPFLEIIKMAEEIPADLTVLGTHGRTGMAHVLLGSVAERVVRKSSCPVLTVKPKGLDWFKKEKVYETSG
jgi:universal stress protein A